MSMQLSPILVYVEFKKTIALEGIVLAMYFCFIGYGNAFPAVYKELPEREAAGCFSVHGIGKKGALTDHCSVTTLIPIEVLPLLQQLQRLPQLKHGGNGVFAEITAITAASEVF